MATKTKTAALRPMTPSWDLLTSSVQLVREHYISVIYLFLIPSLVGLLGSTLMGPLTVENGNIAFTSRQQTGAALMLISLVWQVINLGPLTYFQLRAVSKKSDSLSEIYRHGLRFDLRLVMYYIVFVVLAGVGLLLFIIPGLYVIRRYFLGNYYLVDKNLSVSNALTKSAVDSKPYSGAIWGVIGVQFGLVLLGAFVQSLFSYLGVVIGELIACTYLFLAALRYREISPAGKAL